MSAGRQQSTPKGDRCLRCCQLRERCECKGDADLRPYADWESPFQRTTTEPSHVKLTDQL